MADIMTKSLAFDLHDTEAATPAAARIRLSGVADDRAMLRTAAELTRDLHTPNPLIYWGDFLASASIGYGALALAIFAKSTIVLVLAGMLSVLALYRAAMF